MGLGSLVAKVATDHTLSEMVKERFIRKRVKLPIDQQSYIRASGFAFMCAREEVICVRENITRPDDVNSDTLITFGHGTALHNFLQSYMLPQLGVIRGAWKCIECGHTVGLVPEGKPPAKYVLDRPAYCPKCKTPELDDHDDPNLLFREQFFIDGQTRVGGHNDGFLILPGRSGLGILEAKSISQKGATEVRHTPKIEHVIQAQIYMWLTGCDWAVILYWNKGMYGVKCLIDHVVERDAKTIKTIKATANSIWRGIEKKKLPKRICGTSSCARARECAVRGICFKEELDEPDGHQF